MEITLRKENNYNTISYCVYHDDKFITVYCEETEDSAITRFNEHVKKMQLAKLEELPKIIKSVTI